MQQKQISARKDQLKEIPSTIGVYIFKNGATPVYIGKSVNLRARLTSHFENAKIDAKEASIIETADRISYIVTDSEFKALLLESKLIQHYKPKYNIRWRDDKSYLYIKVTAKDTYPKFFITRRESEKKAVYFGPFSSVRVATDILREIRKVFPFCTQKQIGNRHCFYAKIKLCDPCPSDIEKLEGKNEKDRARRTYRRNVRSAIKVLEGETDLVLKQLYQTMDELKKKEAYEEAILYRDRILRLEGVILRRRFEPATIAEYNHADKRLQSLQKLLAHYFPENNLTRIECYDMSTLGFEDSTASMVVFTEGMSNKQEYKRFKIRNTKAQSDFEMIEEVLERRFKNDWARPDLLVVDGGKPQVRTVRKVLSELQITIPFIGIAKRPDRLIIGDAHMETLRLPPYHPGLQLVQSLRDESHRFAKKYHTFLRTKKML